VALTAARRRASAAAHLLVGLVVVAVGGALLAALVGLWPVLAASPGGGGRARWLGLAFAPSPGVGRLVLVLLASALGVHLGATVEFADAVGNRELSTRWLRRYPGLLVLGAAGALVAYGLLLVLLAADRSSGALGPYGLAAFAAAIGFGAAPAWRSLPGVVVAVRRVTRRLVR
jgi:hypothetical protein